jgi:hypothetical protein
MKKPTKKQRGWQAGKRNPFAREGWRSFVVRSVLADQPARARFTATGETPH